LSLDGLAQLSAVLLLGLLLLLAFAPEAKPEDPPPATTVVELDRKVEGHGVEWWAKRAKQNGKNMRARAHTIRRLKRAARSDGTVREAIQLAAVAYGVSPSMLWRKALCESRLYRFARNAASGAAGLFQFLGSTWRSTPFGRFSVWSPYASAFAAAWMHRAGRGGEWDCR
jgi:hypothetical protein